MSLFCDLPGCRMLDVTRLDPGHLCIVAEGRRDHACSPTCRTSKSAVHSRYQRRPADLPANEKIVRLRLTIRRFYCHHSGCRRLTFAERFPHLLRRYAHRTHRLTTAQARTGHVLGGQPAARLLSHLSMPSSATTVLRTIRALPLPSGPAPHIIGVDDWAKRKGRTYGTVVVDLERRRPIDLLPDRSAGTLAAWLRREAQIRVVARDRSTEYARGTAMGAPDALQVADRWHLLLNTWQMIERWLARVHPRLKQLPSPAPTAASSRRTKAFPRAPAEALTRAAAFARWEILYDDVRRRCAAGHSLCRINRETGLARATVRKYAFAERFPRHGLRGPGSSILDPHLDHLKARLNKGCENAMQLWRELRDLGFSGTPKQVCRWLQERRARPVKTTARQRPTSPSAAPSKASPLPSPKHLLWLLLQEPHALNVEAAATVTRVLQDDEAARVVDLTRQFCSLVRGRCDIRHARAETAAAFDHWLDKAKRCGTRVVESFADSLDQDRAAVHAALQSPWSGGQAEGQINRLKLLKRSMYGRAKLDLLRRRFLITA
ncbi:ISL3 family transposase [Methylobacterium sp. J-088]|uniref:ISL3 family transposase n=1 Tax=Methylobacterium sp. J-088 TaxID=2836664 RepID=UPI001FBB176F|nr:ISL3 family transposase [Methylobacterium sp. J-088]MCJ2063738.1 ISL3 family transposase [Methylobacterium sp. J-088]